MNISLLLMLALSSPQPSLTSRDVADMVTASLVEIVNAKHTVLPRPLVVDVQDANTRFQRLAGVDLPINHTAWLPTMPHEVADRFSELECPQARELSPSCKLRRNATIVHLLSVAADSSGSGYRLAINFVHANPSKPEQLGGFTALLHLKRVQGRWVAREVSRTAG